MATVKSREWHGSRSGCVSASRISRSRTYRQGIPSTSCRLHDTLVQRPRELGTNTWGWHPSSGHQGAVLSLTMAPLTARISTSQLMLCPVPEGLAHEGSGMGGSPPRSTGGLSTRRWSRVRGNSSLSGPVARGSPTPPMGSIHLAHRSDQTGREASRWCLRLIEFRICWTEHFLKGE
jgi:hypothetical protein